MNLPAHGPYGFALFRQTAEGENLVQIGAIKREKKDKPKEMAVAE